MTLWFLDASKRANDIAKEFPGATDWFAASERRLTPGSIVLVHKSHFDFAVDDKALAQATTGVFGDCRVVRNRIRLGTKDLADAVVDFRTQLRERGGTVKLVWFSGDGIDSTTQAEIKARLRNVLKSELPESLFVERHVDRDLDTPTAKVMRSYIEAPEQTQGNEMAVAQANGADRDAANRLLAEVAAWLSLTSGSDYDVAPAFVSVTNRLRDSPLLAAGQVPDRERLNGLRKKWIDLGLIVSKQPHG
jgi:hypothetical protein